MLKAIIFFFLGCMISVFSMAQTMEPIVNDMGIKAISKDSSVSLSLFKRFQSKNSNPDQEGDVYDATIYSPKSVKILESKGKFYVHALEGLSTSVYDLNTFKRSKVIRHSFKESDSALFNNETTLFDYEYVYRKSNFNVFKGKPVESIFSHDGKYLWVTYYRRSYDKNAISPSAVAIIDTDADSIVRVMPTGPLPKMIATSPDNKYVAVTHWGDNTIAVIDIDSENVNDFKYVEHLVVEKKLRFNYGKDQKVDRDNNCGFCLRGTAFTPDSKYLFVGRMGGGGIAIFETESKKYLGTVFGMHANIRHLVMKGDNIYISTNRTGYVEKASIKKLLDAKISDLNDDIVFNDWKSQYIGVGVRTISLSEDEQLIFAAVNNESKIVVLEANDLKVLTKINADSYPVGMDLSDDSKYLMVTSQGKYKLGGGHSVMIYKVEN